jgi:hypothetical protein
VRFCAGSIGNSIATGTQFPPGANANLILESLNPNTSLGWRFSYDSGRREQAAEVVEYTDGSGYAVVGSIDPSGTPATSLLTVSKFDCAGNMLWQRFYGNTGGTNVAWDIIRANTGNGVTTFAGDLIALGEFIPAAGGPTVVRLVRVSNNGLAIRWIREYIAPGGLNLNGRGVTELPPATGVSTGQLVVAGAVGNNAAVIQVNGDTGAFVCGSQLPGLGVSRFNDVATHGSPVIAPGFTPVGETRSATGGNSQIFVASYRHIGCVLQNQIQWGAATASETAQAVAITRATSFTTVPAGQLLIAGNIVGPFGTSLSSSDAWTHLMVPINLIPYTAGGYTGQRYGTQTFGLSGAETAVGVTEAASGGYFVGATSSSWAGVADPLRTLTTRISFNGLKTQCSVPWTAPTAVFTANTSLTVGDPAFTQNGGLNPLPKTPLLPEGLCCAIGP